MSTDDDDARRWLIDDLIVVNTLVAVVAASLAVTLSCSLWRHVRTHPDNSHSILSAPLAYLHLSVAPSTTQQPVPTPAVEERERKSTRSKERRRRGKDPFRDLLKGGKKSKALLNAVKATDHDHDYDHSPPSADTLSNSSIPNNDSASSTSRSQSPDPGSSLLDMDCLAPRLGVDSDDGSVRSATPNGDSSSASAVPLVADISDRGSSDAAQTDSFSTHSSPPDSMTAADMEENISSASTIIADASKDTLSSPSISTACPDIRTPQPRDSQAAYTSESCAKLVRARTKLRISRMDPVKSSLLLATPLPDSVASPSNSIYTTCPSLPSTWVPLPLLDLLHLIVTRSCSRSADAAGPPTPTVSRGSTPPSQSLSTSEDSGPREPNTQSLDHSTAIKLASMRNALEAAHLREEQLRLEAEQASKERDELRWGWNEDANVWRRREAEVSPPLFQCSLGLTGIIASSASTSPHAAASGVRGRRIISGATGLVLLFFANIAASALSTFATASPRLLSASTCNSDSEFRQCTSTRSGTACICAYAHFSPSGVCGISRTGFWHVALVMVWHGTVCSK